MAQLSSSQYILFKSVKTFSGKNRSDFNHEIDPKDLIEPLLLLKKRMAFLSSSKFPGLIKNPFIPSSTSGMPPTFVDIIGKWYDIASNIAIGNPSLYDGKMITSEPFNNLIFFGPKTQP